MDVAPLSLFCTTTVDSAWKVFVEPTLHYMYNLQSDIASRLVTWALEMASRDFYGRRSPKRVTAVLDNGSICQCLNHDRN